MINILTAKNKMNEISVIIPYHNEAKTLEQTLDLLSDQTLSPKEILLVNSSSTDDSSMVIQKWVDRNDHKDKYSIFNMNEGTTVPGSSMNVGIRNASGNLLAFMDCGLLFERNWLQNQKEFMDSHGSEIVSGFCYFKGKTLFDKSAVAQTYGYRRLRPTVPSSLVKKTVFEKTGLFLENRRAGHDVDWVNKLTRERISRDINSNVTIKYHGFNYAKSIKDIFLKTVRYSENAVGLYRYYNHHVYGFFLFFLGFLIFLKIKLFRPWTDTSYNSFVQLDNFQKYITIDTGIVFLIFYIGLRGYIIPLYKSRSLRLIYDHPLALVTLPIIGFIMDLGKIIGYIKGISNLQLRTIPGFKKNKSR
jgi:glycosyltransferase involved in cell wall biosynthesis